MCCQILKRKERKNIKDTMAHQILHPYLSISYLWLNNTATFYCYNDDIRSGARNIHLPIMDYIKHAYEHEETNLKRCCNIYSE